MDGIGVRTRRIEQIAHSSVLEVRGYIDTNTSVEIERRLLEQLAQGQRQVYLDLSDVDYISSAGWGVFISAIRQMREQGGDLKLLGMQPDVHEVYELLEFQSILESWPTLDDAIASVSG